MNISSFYINKKNKLFKNILLFFILSILAYFLVFSKTNFQIMSNTVNIFLEILVPSLFPFILFSNLLTLSSSFNLIAKSKFNKLIKKVFKISSSAASSIIFGFLFGYPNGARYVNELYEKKKINYDEAEYLLLFVNNASPNFILSSVGIGMLQSIQTGVVLLVSHIFGAILIGLIYRFRYRLNKHEKYCKDTNYNVYNSYNNTMIFSFDVLYNSILKSLLTLGIIFGFITIFILLYNYIISIIINIIDIDNTIKSALLCVMEVSSGLEEFTKLNLSLKNMLPFVSFFLGFSSLSIIFQVFSCVYLSKFKLKNILKGKLLHGIFSFLITYILINIPYVYEYINIGKEVNSNIDSAIKYANLSNHTLISLVIFTIHILIFCIFILVNKKKRLRKSLNRFKRGIMF